MVTQTPNTSATPATTPAPATEVTRDDLNSLVWQMDRSLEAFTDLTGYFESRKVDAPPCHGFLVTFEHNGDISASQITIRRAEQTSCIYRLSRQYGTFAHGWGSDKSAAIGHIEEMIVAVREATRYVAPTL